MVRNEINGILVVDKPPGLSSAQVVSRIKRSSGVKKIGHAGTLDPFATGVLVCCLNKSTRLSQFFLGSHKTYEAVLELGVETDTLDCTGTIVSESDFCNIARPDIEAAFSRFKGNIRQIPPVYSALKHKGVPLYKLARKGKPVQKPPRDIFISALDILEINLPNVRFQVTCSAGTYVRTLGADIGKILGCGAHLKALKRTASGSFTLNQAISLDAIQNQPFEEITADRIIPMSKALGHFPAYVADDTLKQKISYGIRLSLEEIPWPDNPDALFMCVVDAANHLLAVLHCKKNHSVYDYCCVFA